MITWAWPWAFVLWIPVLLLPWQPRWTGRARLRVPGPQIYDGGRSLRQRLSSLPLLLRMAGLALLVVALARPQEIRRSTVRTSEGIDIILALDTSGSMRAEDLSAGATRLNRLQVAKAVMDRFIEGRPHDRIGMVVFGEEAFTHVPLTLDHTTLRDVLRMVSIGAAGESRTAIGSAIAVGARRLKDIEATERVLILLTDGQNNAGRLSPLEAAELAAAVGVRVYTIGVGPTRSRRSLFGFSEDAVDADNLTQVAEVTGGRFLHASDASSLERVFDAIDRLEPSPGETEDLVERDERFHAWAGWGAGLLALELLLSLTLLRRSP